MGMLAWIPNKLHQESVSKGGVLRLSVIFGREASFILAPPEFGIVGVTSSKNIGSNVSSIINSFMNLDEREFCIKR